MGLRSGFIFAVLLCAQALAGSAASASEFFRPWADPKRAIVLDGYAHNIVDFHEIAKDKRVTAFIHKGSDGLPPQYRCKGDYTERALCRQTWQRYAIAKELYRTRRTLAKKLGLKWGAYHLGRAGDPLEQARHFVEYADPQPDELMAIDIEGLDSEKWMSLKDAERFAIRIHELTGRYPVLYANELVSRRIAEASGIYPILSRLPLWYARYQPTVRNAFPKGNWDSYHIWQFAYQGNCTRKRCPYRVGGTGRDIDVNIVDMTPKGLRAAWPISRLLEEKTPFGIPLPVARPTSPEIAIPPVRLARWEFPHGTHEVLAKRRSRIAGYRQHAAIRLKLPVLRPADADRILTASFGSAVQIINDLY